ncbi:metalloregulator ArsR/SmtB family transcription factor [Iamia majanohamensis]|uniref:Metalloregulator ArsR/SmtB family transcription factor n=1 Tax=Iamia majanohamensis TaxID=467976 RepID=A0AAE9Y6S8_9ACTN|nr:metalloregulator ArsR/SmtB family transcription factor [Iamia majanohamensis]WCO65433.1 metalloregulator ArsR/SmtB family transcription factor [Iamia majanohamensis]
MLNTATRLDTMARVGRALADRTRCLILLRLLDGPAFPAEMADDLGLSRPNVSNHLTCLRGCGLVVGTPMGRRVRYELAEADLARALESLLAVALVVDDGCPT